MLDQPRYLVNGYESEGGQGAVVFTFVPKADQSPRNPGIVPKHAPRFTVAVRSTAEGLDFDWSGSPDQPGAAGAEIQAEIRTRMQERAVWIERVNELVAWVERRATELGWSTRRIEKELEDARVGAHRVPALLMQADTCRIILEPIGRSAPGLEGVVDLYLLPAYDDIASIYYREGRWYLHYQFPDRQPMAPVGHGQPTPLSQETLGSVLAEMKQHAV